MVHYPLQILPYRHCHHHHHAPVGHGAFHSVHQPAHRFLGVGRIQAQHVCGPVVAQLLLNLPRSVALLPTCLVLLLLCLGVRIEGHADRARAGWHFGGVGVENFGGGRGPGKGNNMEAAGKLCGRYPGLYCLRADVVPVPDLQCGSGDGCLQVEYVVFTAQ